MSLTTVEYVYSGQVLFPLPFPLGILSREYITVQVNDQLDGSGDPLLYTDFTWLSNTEITINGLVLGDTIRISRTVPKLELISSFEEGSDVSRTNLDMQAKQTIMIYHELIDNRASALSGTDVPTGAVGTLTQSIIS